MRYSIILAVSIYVLFPAIGFSATLKVPSQYPTIQDAIDAASGGDTVLVAPGTYVENIDFLGKAITVTSEQGADGTTIDGSNPVDPDFGSVVRFMNGEGSDSVIDGFTLTNGSGTVYLPYGLKGGGVYCEDTSPKIINNIITKNTAYYGAGIITMMGAAWIENNLIFGNTSEGKADSGGGGMDISLSSKATVMNNTITENEGRYGGGITVWGNSTPNISNNIISANKAMGAGNSYGGSIIVDNGSSPMIVNNMISGNFASWGGSGIGISNGSSADIVNNTIYGNIADPAYMGGGGGVCLVAAGKATIINTILWSNDAPKGPEIYIGGPTNPSTVTISYSDVQGGQPSVFVDSNCTLNWGAGMIDSDPLFVDSANSDFHLTFNSPCRGSGDNTAVIDLHDFENDPRIAYGTVDMGADEFYTHLYWTGDATPGGNVEVKLVGLPGTSPVFLWVGSGVLGAPIPTMYGDWHLDFPILLSLGLGPIVTPEGVSVLPYTFDPGFPAMDIPMQSLIGAELSNLCVLEVK